MLRKTKINSKSVSLLLCFIMAFFLWAYVINSENPDRTRWVKNIPITIEGESKLNAEDFAILEIPEKIDLKISANHNLFKEISSNATAVADVSSLTGEGVHTVKVTLSVNGLTAGSAKILSSDEITVTVDKYMTQEVEIVPDIGELPPKDYLLIESRINSTSNFITVSGCASDVSRIERISTEEVNLSKSTEDCQFSYSLKAVDTDGNIVDNVKLSQTNINVSFTIHKIVELPLAVEINGDQEDRTVELSVQKIRVCGPVKTVNELDVTQPVVVGTVNERNDIGFEGSFSIKSKLPSGVSLCEGEAESVEYTIVED